MAAIVILHGSGGSGENMRNMLNCVSEGEFLQSLTEADVRIEVPDAPEIQYSPMGGALLPCWFDRETITYEAPEDRPGIQRSVEQIDLVIDALINTGVPVEKIGIIGHSQGGCLALHVVYGRSKYAGRFAFCASMSAFLAADSELDAVATEHFRGAAAPPLFMGHGRLDAIVPSSFAEKTRMRLGAAGVDVPAHVPLYVDCGRNEHMVSHSELRALLAFTVRQLGLQITPDPAALGEWAHDDSKYFLSRNEITYETGEVPTPVVWIGQRVCSAWFEEEEGEEEEGDAGQLQEFFGVFDGGELTWSADEVWKRL